MGRAFSNDDREAISPELYAFATQLFAARGLRGTTIEELTKSVGISKASFYAFYPSKEALFLEIAEHRAAVMWAEARECIQQEKKASALVEELFDVITRSVRADPLVTVMFGRSEAMYLIRKIGRDPFDAARNRNEAHARVLADAWSAAGLGEVDPGLLTAFVTLALGLEHMRPLIDEDLFGRATDSLRLGFRAIFDVRSAEALATSPSGSSK